MKSSLHLTIGFQSRSDTYSGMLGFIVPTSEEKSNKNFTRWVDQKIPLKRIINEPIPGFVFNKNIKRNFTYSTSEKMRVFHPEGFEFEITMNNLSFIIANANINAQEIMSPCVLAWFRGSVHLVPVNTEEGQEIIKVNALEKEVSHLSVGEIIEIKKKQYIYLGNRNYLGISKHTLFNIKDKNYHSFSKLPEYTSLNKKEDASHYISQLTKLDSIRKSNKKISRKVTTNSILSFLYHELNNNKPNFKNKTQELNYLVSLLQLLGNYANNFYFKEEVLYEYRTKNDIINALQFNEKQFIVFFRNLFHSQVLYFDVVQIELTFIFIHNNNLDKTKNISEYLDNDFSHSPNDFKLLGRMLTY